MPVIVIITAIWMAIDASKLGYDKRDVSGMARLSPGGWLLLGLFFWILGFPLYLIKRGELKAAGIRRRQLALAGQIPHALMPMGFVAPPMGPGPHGFHGHQPGAVPPGYAPMGPGHFGHGPGIPGHPGFGRAPQHPGFGPAPQHPGFGAAPQHPGVGHGHPGFGPAPHGHPGSGAAGHPGHPPAGPGPHAPAIAAPPGHGHRPGPIAHRPLPGPPPAAPTRAPQPPAPRARSVADEIAKLGELRIAGLLTEAEFTEQKRRLLGLG